MSYLNFLVSKRLEGRKTDVWSVASASNPSDEVGRIGWYGPWRKYCFYALNGSVFDSKCLSEIVQFLEQQNAAHKNGGVV
jgi:hypothetical protein